jgi:hypothetical protein
VIPLNDHNNKKSKWLEGSSRGSTTMTKAYVRHFIALLAFMYSGAQMARGDCIASNPTLNEEIAGEGRTVPLPGSCCMADVCGLECPQTTPPPAPGEFDTVTHNCYPP